MTLRLAGIGVAAVAAVFGTIALTGHAARAFTINTESATDAYGNARFADRDEQVQNFGRGGRCSVRADRLCNSVGQGPSTAHRAAAIGFHSPLGLDSSAVESNPDDCRYDAAARRHTSQNP